MRSVTIDGPNGKVTVSGSIDPYTLQNALAKIGKRVEILWDSSGTVNPHSTNQNHSLVTSQTQGLDRQQLEQLAKIKGVKQVELSHTKTIKITLNDDSCQDFSTCTTNFLADDFSGQTAPHHHLGGGGSGDAITHGCCGHNNRTMNNSNYYSGNGRAPLTTGCRCCTSSAPLALPQPLMAAPPPPPPMVYSRPSVFSDENPDGCKLM